MTLTRESEAFVSDLLRGRLSREAHETWETAYTRRLARIEAAVRAEQAAEMAEVRDQLDALLANGPELRVWLEYRREAREQAAEVERLRAIEAAARDVVEDDATGNGRQTRHLMRVLEAALAATPVAPAISNIKGSDGDPSVGRGGSTSPAGSQPSEPDQTPVAPAPAAPERWALVPGEDDDCPRCGRVKLRWVPPEYEPGGWVCDDCGWDSRDSRPVAPAPAAPEPVGTMTDDEWAEWSDAIAPEPRP